ncbi:MAG: response regulator [Planctomycetes bacterium]|nr:response regulator [Planctomycetota bacterium]
MKSLVIDDQITARTLLRCILESYGVVDDVSTGQDGLRMFKNAVDQGEGYDLICIDLGLPDLSGMQVLTDVRDTEDSMGLRRGKGAATVLMITGNSDPSRATEAFDNQVDGYLEKPVSYENLIEALAGTGLLPAPSGS